jgi:hypothetical protein
MRERLAPHPSPLPADPAPRRKSLELIEYVDFKWLMFAEGHQVHLERLQADRAYARCCLALAGVCASPTLHLCAENLARAMGLLPAAALP